MSHDNKELEYNSLTNEAKHHPGLKAAFSGQDSAPNAQQLRPKQKPTPWQTVRISVSIVLLFLNYFTAQYDKFILSYFQTSFSQSLNLSANEYGVLSGYATGIVYALLAIPIAYLADYFPAARVWTLALASAWWSLCVIFQSLCHGFWQVLLARIGMGLGQSAVEALSISLISDMIQWRNVFLGSSAFYVGVYIGEAVSGQIAVAFPDRQDGWRIALRAIGIVGIVLAVLVRLVVRDTDRQNSIIDSAQMLDAKSARRGRTIAAARIELQATVSYLMRMHSFWVLVLSAAFRQLGGNVFGYYMPSYLANTYPDHPELLSRYGIIVGVVGSVSVLSGGLLTSLLWHKTKLTPLYMTGVGGLISSLFVLLMVFSRNIAKGDQDTGVKILYGVMSIAYLTAETWLGALNGFIALLLPPRYKTFGLAVWSAIQVLVYSAGPAIIGLSLRKTDTASTAYTKDTQVALSVLIPVGYWVAGIGFLLAVPLLRRDMGEDLTTGVVSKGKRVGAWIFGCVLFSLVIGLFVASIVYAAE